MKIYITLLFSVAALLSVLGIFLCRGKLKRLKFESGISKKSVGKGFLLVSVLLLDLGLIILFRVKGTLFLLVSGSFVIRSIFTLLRRENID